MKIRTDFVTNSSSSSFIIARKEELTEEQKEIIIDFVVRRMLGEKVLDDEEKLEEFAEEHYIDDSYKEEIKKSIKNGLSIYEGCVSFESEYEFANVLSELWEALENADSENFVGIDTSLEY